MDDLRKIAERARGKAPGPWTFDWESEPENAPENFWPWGVITHHEGTADIILATSTPGGVARQPDPIGEYIAAVSPDVFLKLLDGLESQEKMMVKLADLAINEFKMIPALPSEEGTARMVAIARTTGEPLYVAGDRFPDANGPWMVVGVMVAPERVMLELEAHAAASRT